MISSDARFKKSENFLKILKNIIALLSSLNERYKATGNTGENNLNRNITGKFRIKKLYNF